MKIVRKSGSPHKSERQWQYKSLKPPSINFSFGLPDCATLAAPVNKLYSLPVGLVKLHFVNLLGRYVFDMRANS
jgi:hypothetical protein